MSRKKKEKKYWFSVQSSKANLLRIDLNALVLKLASDLDSQCWKQIGSKKEKALFKEWWIKQSFLFQSILI